MQRFFIVPWLLHNAYSMMLSPATLVRAKMATWLSLSGVIEYGGVCRPDYMITSCPLAVIEYGGVCRPD